MLLNQCTQVQREAGGGQKWDCSRLGTQSKQRHCKVYSSQLRTVTAPSINTTTSQCHLNHGPLVGLAFRIQFLVISMTWHFKNHFLAKHTRGLTLPPSPSKTLTYLITFKHVSTSVVVTRTSKVLVFSGVIFAELVHSANNCAGDAASRTYDRILRVFTRR